MAFHTCVHLSRFRYVHPPRGTCVSPVSHMDEFVFYDLLMIYLLHQHIIFILVFIAIFMWCRELSFIYVFNVCNCTMLFYCCVLIVSVLFKVLFLVWLNWIETFTSSHKFRILVTYAFVQVYFIIIHTTEHIRATLVHMWCVCKISAFHNAVYFLILFAIFILFTYWYITLTHIIIKILKFYSVQNACT